MKSLTTLFLGIILFFYSSETPLLEQIKASGEVRVVTRQGFTTYYEGPSGKAGLEYELAKRFAEELGVKLRIIVADNFTDILHKVANHQVHFAAAGLTVTQTRQALVRFGPNYQEVTQQLVYHKDSPSPPKDLAKWNADDDLYVIAGSNQVELLKHLKADYPQLTWKELKNIKPSELLERVWEREIQYALVDSNEIARMQSFYPELQIGLELPEHQLLAWAFPRSNNDNSLYSAAIQFFNQLQSSGELEQLIERYYGHIDPVEDFNPFNISAFFRHIQERLPKYRKHFEMMAARHQTDWRLLAAIGYQESQWDPDAVSVTGVRGLMMLTKLTAREMGIKNRQDPFESIRGGSKYFLAIKKRIPKPIPEPDRTWFALAAYNVGLGHLRDVRKLTKQAGDNPNHWVDVKKHLPKLSKQYWYDQTEHGYARGSEPVQFVKNVRRFYDILVHLDAKPDSIETLLVSPPQLSKNSPPGLNSPLL